MMSNHFEMKPTISAKDIYLLDPKARGIYPWEPQNICMLLSMASLTLLTRPG